MYTLRVERGEGAPVELGEMELRLEPEDAVLASVAGDRTDERVDVRRVEGVEALWCVVVLVLGVS